MDSPVSVQLPEQGARKETAANNPAIVTNGDGSGGGISNRISNEDSSVRAPRRRKKQYVFFAEKVCVVGSDCQNYLR